MKTDKPHPLPVLKRMCLKPSEMGLLNMEEQNAEIAIKDASLLNMKGMHDNIPS